MNARFPLFALLMSATLLAACKPATPPAEAASTAETRIGDLLITSATSRETPLAGGTGPGFMTIANRGATDDRLLSATSPETTSVELHEMSMADGQMTMRALPEGLLIPAGGTVDLAPGGIHLMLIGVRDALVAGQTVPVELRFEKAGTVTVPLSVKARSPAP
ncbi:copper chaperone PCu(A)C [Nevskia sp.]|uniref:copper chaperone PCu(A)C n=1 Tax=Nevskia sp. TaxID=1929292 RepID=UPI0025F8783D|nr:copper chaperone PCu(A)C [Nevskia sp.]